MPWAELWMCSSEPCASEDVILSATRSLYPLALANRNGCNRMTHPTVKASMATCREVRSPCYRVPVKEFHSDAVAQDNAHRSHPRTHSEHQKNLAFQSLSFFAIWGDAVPITLICAMVSDITCSENNSRVVDDLLFPRRLAENTKETL